MAATGLAKNIVPNREKTRSYGPPSASVWTSARKNSAFERLACSASIRAASTNRPATSTPQALPAGPTARARADVTSPKPHPTSSARAPGARAMRESAASLWRVNPVVRMFRNRTNLSKRTPSHAAVASSFEPGPAGPAAPGAQVEPLLSSMLMIPSSRRGRSRTLDTIHPSRWNGRWRCRGKTLAKASDRRPSHQPPGARASRSTRRCQDTNTGAPRSSSAMTT